MVRGALLEPKLGSPSSSSSVVKAGCSGGCCSARASSVGVEVAIHCCKTSVPPLPIPSPKVSQPTAFKTLMRWRLIAICALILFLTILALKTCYRFNGLNIA